MRPIKFKAWDVWGKKIVDWDRIWDNKSYLFDFMMNITINLIPMQYTGLNDRDGKEIYEGYILQHENGFIGDVAYINNAFNVYPITNSSQEINNEAWEDFTVEYSDGHSPFTIIDNIYNNIGNYEI